MPKIEYRSKQFSDAHLSVIDQANEIIEDYQAQGYRLTLRQLYYQFVARDLIANTIQSYKRLGGIISDGRLAGLIDWLSIEDRTRAVQSNSHWRSPSDILDTCAKQFRLDLWAGQQYRPEVWVEKEALAGVFEPICRELDIAWLSCRGYTSQSILWECARRLMQSAETPLILHFGDHDPSGIDMTRDMRDRLAMFGIGYPHLKFVRVALNRDQVDQYNPPPNPAKLTDSRCRGYILEHGSSSWELDALQPRVLAELVRDLVLEHRDDDLYEQTEEEQNADRQRLQGVADDWRKEL